MSCNDASDSKYNITIYQNSSFQFAFQLEDNSGSAIPLTGWTFTGSIKEQYTDPDPSLLFFTCSIATGSIIVVKLSAAQTSLLSNPRYVYDIIGVDSATVPPTVRRLLMGSVKVSPGVTDV